MIMSENQASPNDKPYGLQLLEAVKSSLDDLRVRLESCGCPIILDAFGDSVVDNAIDVVFGNQLQINRMICNTYPDSDLIEGNASYKPL